MGPFPPEKKQEEKKKNWNFSFDVFLVLSWNVCKILFEWFIKMFLYDKLNASIDVIN